MGIGVLQSSKNPHDGLNVKKALATPNRIELVGNTNI